MGRISKDRINKLKKIAHDQGISACLNEADSNAEAILVCEGLDYDFVLDEAKHMQEDLENGVVDSKYMNEKIKNIKDFQELVEARRKRKQQKEKQQ